ncbi:hypothetical protein Lalb_Chr19g0129311 [Lupinus albus]|uniref:Uncharacterized protein n=1 Tax=Lupinus albus TaxID=3870 RepID=A0A6A4NTC8_LUPAL|nr:hypothetical protein Lalb_Chr19g0129311 [Lupinus albus]
MCGKTKESLTPPLEFSSTMSALALNEALEPGNPVGPVAKGSELLPGASATSHGFGSSPFKLAPEATSSSSTSTFQPGVSVWSRTASSHEHPEEEVAVSAEVHILKNKI